MVVLVPEQIVGKVAVAVPPTGGVFTVTVTWLAEVHPVPDTVAVAV